MEVFQVSLGDNDSEPIVGSEVDAVLKLEIELITNMIQNVKKGGTLPTFLTFDYGVTSGLDGLDKMIIVTDDKSTKDLIQDVVNKQDQKPEQSTS